MSPLEWWVPVLGGVHLWVSQSEMTSVRAESIGFLPIDAAPSHAALAHQVSRVAPCAVRRARMPKRASSAPTIARACSHLAV